MDLDIGSHYLETVRFEFERLKRQAEGALQQLPEDEDWAYRLDVNANSVAILVQHLAGNMISRWTDFLESDGEKPDRDRNREFLAPDPSTDPSKRLARWEDAWALVFDQLARLTPSDLTRTTTIRGEPFTAVEALQRQLLHLSYHVGQIVLLAKHRAGTEWKTLSIPKGQSPGKAGGYKKR